MNIDIWFLLIFILFWILGPFSQLVQLIAPNFHKKIGFMEEKTFEPQYKWFYLEEKAIAIADMSFLIAGIIFVIGSLLKTGWTIPFGIFVCTVYIYFGIMSIMRWILLGKNNLSPVSKKQLPVYVIYMLLFVIFGFFGLFYLWSKV